jgi:hypothetical protein
VDPDSLNPDPDPEFQVNPDLDLNFLKNNTAKIFYIFLSKIAIYLSLGLLEGHPRYRRSLQPSK